jgi:hypothetical protein
MHKLALLAGLVGMMFALAVACFENEVACAQEEGEIVSNIPWSDDERAEYILLDHSSQEQCGTGTLTVERQGDTYQFVLAFAADENTDVSTVVVDDETLYPFTVRRVRVIDGETEAVEGEYDREENVIRVVEYSGDDDPREVPRRLDEEVYYDNESSIFIWRTIRFEEGYEAKYNTVLVNQGGALREIELRVRGKEEITVPAGTFNAWRVDINAADVQQVAFFADTPEHELLFYDNSLQIFQLVSFEP